MDANKSGVVYPGLVVSGTNLDPAKLLYHPCILKPTTANAHCSVCFSPSHDTPVTAYAMTPSKNKKGNTAPRLPVIHINGTRLIIFAYIARVMVMFLLSFLDRRIPMFDTSPQLLSREFQPSSFWNYHDGARWDAIHYLSVATEGYRWEQQLAFMPGWPAVLRLLKDLVSAVPWARNAPVRFIDNIGILLGSTCQIAATVELFKCVSSHSCMTQPYIR
jgi:hypothetical protein